VAVINVGSSGTSIAVTLGVIIFIIALAYILLVRNPNFLKSLTGLTGNLSAAAAT
jgi:hypothetical protein